MAEKIIINGGNLYYDTVEIEPKEPLNHAIHKLQFQMFQHLQSQCGLHDNLEVGLHIKISKERKDFTDKEILVGKMETIPIIEQEYRVLMPVEPEPYLVNRKCTLKERLKILFKGEL